MQNPDAALPMMYMPDCLEVVKRLAFREALALLLEKHLTQPAA